MQESVICDLGMAVSWFRTDKSLGKTRSDDAAPGRSGPRLLVDKYP